MDGWTDGWASREKGRALSEAGGAQKGRRVKRGGQGGKRKQEMETRGGEKKAAGEEVKLGP